MSSDSDSGPEDRTPAKKAKTEEPAKAKAEGKKRAAPQADDGEDPKQIKLGNNRFVSVREFKNKVYVDIREFYLNNDGVRCPGKKGIMLSLEQWKKVAESADRITEMASAM